MNVIVLNVGEEPKLVEMENSLESFQQAVGGYIEGIGVSFEGKDYAAYVNEEGKLLDLPFNRAFMVDGKPVDTLNGNMIILHMDSETDLTEEDLKSVQQNITSTFIHLRR